MSQYAINYIMITSLRFYFLFQLFDCYRRSFLYMASLPVDITIVYCIFLYGQFKCGFYTNLLDILYMACSNLDTITVHSILCIINYINCIFFIWQVLL